MQLNSLVVSPDEAREKLAEYEEALKIERNAEDVAIAAGYRAAARGLPVIRLSEAVQAGGFFDSGLPRIAVVRADATECWVRWRWSGSDRRLVFCSTDRADWRGALLGRTTVSVPIPEEHFSRWGSGHTVVPLVPPRCRPRRPRLERCHVLWEVEAWDPTPPRDPALLRHIRGDLWAVLAVWDLTELERAVLSQRSLTS